MRPYLVGIMLFVFDLFGPLKALLRPERGGWTVKNSCMDRTREFSRKRSCRTTGLRKSPRAQDAPSEVRLENVVFAYGEKMCWKTFL
jgi:ATP-binding cassette subfamily B protein